MLGGSAWAGRGDRAFASVEYTQQRPLAEWKRKRARRRAEFAARIPVTAAQVASEISAAVASEVKAAVAAALEAAFARHDEAIQDAVINAKDRPGAYVTSSPSSAQTASVTSERAMSVQTAAAAEPISVAVGAASICSDSDLALATPITCSTECSAKENGATGAMTAPSASPTSVVPSVSVVHEDGIHLAVPCLQPSDIIALLPSTAMPTTSAALPEYMVAMENPSTHSTLSPTMPTSVTTKPATSAAFRSDLTMAANYAVCHETVPDVPAIVLTQATLDITDSSGSSALVSMLMPLHKPENADNSGNHEVANTYEVMLPFKLLVPLSKNKELYLSPLLPKFTQAMAAWGSYVNQLHPTCSTMCSGLGCATINSVCLLPWDPGEKPVILRDSVLSIGWGACVKKSDADLSVNHDRHQKSRYTTTQTYFHWPFPVFCSSENATGKCSCKGTNVELLQFQFDSVDTFSKQYVEFLIALAPYPVTCAAQVPFEDFLLEYLCAVPSNFQPLYPEVRMYLSLAACSCAHVTAESFFPYGSVSRPWDFAWSSLFAILTTIQSTTQLGSCILWSRAAVLNPLAYENSTWKEPMEQWDPGIARTVDIYTQYCHVSCHLILTAVATEVSQKKLLQDGFHLYTINYAVLHGHEHIQAADFVMDRVIPSLLDYLLQFYDAGHM